VTIDLQDSTTKSVPLAASDQRSLDRALVHGVAWTGAFRWFTQAGSWVVSLVLARLLTPADYGIFGYTTLYVGLIQLVNEFGLGAAIVQNRKLDRSQISALGGLSLLLAISLWVVSAAVSPLVATFFKAPDLSWPLIALSGTFVTTGLKVLPRSLLSRELAFRRVAALDATEALLGTVTTLVLALLGFRYWSLVLGTVFGGLVGTMVALAWRPHPLSWPRDWPRLRASVTFGSHMMVSRLSWYGYSNADFATVGRVLGQALLGAYTYAWSIASIPVDRVSTLIGQVIPGIFAAVQDDPPAMRRYLVRITETLALITFPLAFGLASVADQFVVLVLGPRWWPAIGPMAILALYAAVRSVTTPFSHVLVAVGRASETTRFNLIGLAVLLPLFYLGTHWGVEGVALAWVIGYPIVVIPMFRAIQRATGLGLSEYANALRPALRASLFMAAVVIAVRISAPAGWPAGLAFGAAVGAGAATYLALVWRTGRDRLRQLRALAAGAER
jgi:teichuronic acid exporter